jgi:hypothetical protein
MTAGTARLNSPDHLVRNAFMDPSGVLLALEEQKKWRERRKRIRERIRQLERRRSTLRKELDGIRNKILQYGRVLLDIRGGPQAGNPILPIGPGR